MPAKENKSRSKNNQVQEKLGGNMTVLEEDHFISQDHVFSSNSYLNDPSNEELKHECSQLDEELRKIQIESRLLALEQRQIDIKNRLNVIRPMLGGENSSNSEEKIETPIPNIITLGSDLPKVEISYFYGDPVNYWSFMKEFESNIANKTSDDSLKLAYLKQYCKGDAKKAVESCCMLPANEGYRMAMQNLKELFGNDYRVSRALIDSMKRDIRDVKDNPVSWHLLALKMKDCLATFEYMNKAQQLDSFETLESLVKCLPGKIRDKWVEQSGRLERDGQQPRFSDLVNLINDVVCFNTSSFYHLASKSHRESPPKSHRFDNRNVFSVARKSTKRVSNVCPKCGGDHRLDKCEDFLNLAIEERLSFTKTKALCFMCLGANHLIKDCRYKHPCAIDGCKKLHSPLLHTRAFPNVQPNPNCVALTSKNQSVQLGLLPVRICSRNKSLITYALLDPGSEVTLVKRSLVKKLDLTGKPSSLNIVTATGNCSLNTQEVSLSVESLDGSASIEITDAFTVNSLPLREANVPSDAELKRWNHLNDIQFPDFSNKSVGILIGSNVSEAHWALDQRLGDRREPYAIKTLLGWIVRGPLYCKSSTSIVNNIVLDSSLDAMIARLYDKEFEDMNDDKVLSQDDVKAIDLVANSKRFESGHYVIGLPWKYDKTHLPDNKALAIGRLQHLKGKFVRNPELHRKYKEVIDNYLLNGYARLVPKEQRDRTYMPKWYLPHHPVMTAKKPGKVRVVFDCAAQYKGISLNHCLYSGPNVISDLVGVIMRFRENHLAIVADIKEMFLQVHVNEEDTGALRFLWWPDGDLSSQPEEYQLLVHLFGATSSPYCANFALKQTAIDFADQNNSRLKDVIRDNFYVDDCLLSVDSRREAEQLIKDLVTTLKRGGFLLTKWVSNDPSLLLNVCESPLSSHSIDLNPDATSQRTLGLQWNCSLDTFQIASFDRIESPTKRSVLSMLSSVFDPLGFAAPFIFPGKLLLQDMFRKKKEWDDPLSEESSYMYEEWCRKLNYLNKIHFPRCVKSKADIERFELHVFSDASELGYGAVAYLFSETTQHERQCNLIFSKSKVAPLKSISIPRLELTAAVLATRIATKIMRECRLPIKNTTFWTDSMIVLYYINNSTTRYRTFVANRLTEIRTTTSPHQWKHIPGQQNPADAISRIVKCDDQFWETWICGPKFLIEPEESWPKQPSNLDIDESLIEQKKSQKIVLMTLTPPLHELLTYFSSWTRLLKAIAWMTRFKTYIQTMYGKKTDCSLFVGPLRLEDIKNAERDLIKVVQRESFNKELRCLEKNSSIPKSSRLYKLNPTLVDGLLRVGSRLANNRSSLFITAPIIIPSDHHITSIVINYYHRLEGHCGTVHTLNSIRIKYWILKGQKTVRNTLSKCILCRRLNGKPCSQLMAPLPESRSFKADTPFSAVGIDYFGPFFVKHGRSLEKRYGCLFTCLKVRAVHLELTHSLTTESFLMAFTRFIGRRGIPEVVYSDNGTNLVGAESILKNCIKGWSKDRIRDQMHSRGVEWIFNPPDCSHRGGVWERMIRSTKRILRALTYRQTLTDETLITFIVEAERIMNSRPICPISDDARDPIALTPSMILLLRDNNVDISEHHSNVNLRCWRHACNISRAFWKRWVREYLSTLHLRQKWFKPSLNLKIGDLVLLLSEGLTYKEWPLGLIVDTKMNDDGLVREVTVKTTKGLFRRDVRKICLLESSE